MLEYNTADSIAAIDRFNPTKEQLQAIESRDYNLASRLGVKFDQYMAVIQPNYRTLLESILKIERA